MQSNRASRLETTVQGSKALPRSKRKKARKKNFEALAELHTVLDKYENQKELVMNRYMSYFSTASEQKLEEFYIHSVQASTNRGLREDYDDPIYPLIE